MGAMGVIGVAVLFFAIGLIHQGVDAVYVLYSFAGVGVFGIVMLILNYIFDR